MTITTEGVVAILAGITGLIVAIARLISVINKLSERQIQTHDMVNSKMGEFITVAQLASKREGELAGRDYASHVPPVVVKVEAPTDVRESPESGKL